MGRACRMHGNMRHAYKIIIRKHGVKILFGTPTRIDRIILRTMGPKK
jgi:hypothetical protein